MARSPAPVVRLLRRVEQQTAARALTAHHAHSCLGRTLAGEEVELAAWPERLLVHIANRAMPRGARVGDQDVQAVRHLADCAECPLDRLRVGDVAGDPHAPNLYGHPIRARTVHVEDCHDGPGVGKGSGDCCTDGTCSPGDHANTAARCPRLPTSELRGISWVHGARKPSWKARRLWSLHQQDLGEGNLIASGDTFVFFDWSDTVIPHPACRRLAAERAFTVLDGHDQRDQAANELADPVSARRIHCITLRNE